MKLKDPEFRSIGTHQDKQKYRLPSIPQALDSIFGFSFGFEVNIAPCMKRVTRVMVPSLDPVLEGY